MPDPVVLLKKDHREAEALLKSLAVGKPGARRHASLDKLEAALTLHMQIEEKLIYPLIPAIIDNEAEEEASNEHSLVRDGLAEMRKLADEPGFGCAVAMLTAGIKHHVKEEEHEMFPKLKRSLDRSELSELGDAVVAAKSSKPKTAKRPRVAA